MDIFFELLQTLFLFDAEFLFFINDQQGKVIELDLFTQQCMGADDDIEVTFFEVNTVLVSLFC